MYGGTKSEMERLLADAQKLTGVHYDISNFSDIIQAIHAIQDNLGITGTTAEEAATTIEGSLNMTKAAWKNMLTSIAQDDNNVFEENMNALIDSASAFGSNILPRVEIILNGIGELISRLLPEILDRLPEIISSTIPSMVEAGVNIISALGNAILQSLPMVVSYGVQLIQNLLNGIQQSLPSIANCVIQVISSLTTGLLEVLPQVLSIGMQTIAYLAQGIGQQLPTLIPLAVQCIMQLIQNFYDNEPLIIDAGMQLLSGLAEGIINAIPVLIEMLPQVIDSMLNYLTTSLPLVLEQGCNILLALVDGIVQAIPQIIAVLPQIIESLITFFTENLPQIIQTGIQVVLALINGLIQALPTLIAYLPQINKALIDGVLNNLPALIKAGIEIIIALIKGLIMAIPQLIAAIPQIIKAIQDTFKSVNWWEVGLYIIKGIGKGIAAAAGDLWEQAKEACAALKDKVKAFFGIHSPSRVMRDEVGVNLIKGIAVGLKKELPTLINAATDICSKLNSAFKKELNKETAQNYIDSIYNVSGDFSYIQKNIEKSQKALDEIKNTKPNKELSDTEKKQVQAKIDAAEKYAEKEVEIAKEKKEKLTDLAKATTEALKNQLEKQKDNALNAIEAQEDSAKKAYDNNCDRIEKQADKRKNSIEEKIKDLDEEKEAESRLQEVQKANASIAVLQAKMNNTASEADKKAYALKIKNAKSALQAKEEEWDRTDEKDKLKEEQKEIEDRAQNRKERLKEEYEEHKEQLERKKQATEEYYKTLLSTDNLNAQARYLLLQGSSEQLVQLLQSYNPKWQNAGQSLADSLINGLNSKREDMASAISSLMGSRSGTKNLPPPPGFASGTSSNPVAGIYNLDEKGFELSTNGSIGYVSKGAGILNHMQSLAAIKEEVKAQVATLGNRLRNAVMAEQYRMGKLAMATTNNSYSKNINNSTNYGGHLLNVEHMEIRSQSDIESLANELESYKQRKRR